MPPRPNIRNVIVALVLFVPFSGGAGGAELASLEEHVLSQGKTKVLDASISAALGYGTPPNIRQKGWQTDDSMRHFSMINTDNRTDIILVLQTAEGSGYAWLTDRSGALRSTVKTGNGEATKVENSEAGDQFNGQKKYFLGKVPAPAVQATPQLPGGGGGCGPGKVSVEWCGGSGAALQPGEEARSSCHSTCEAGPPSFAPGGPWSCHAAAQGYRCNANVPSSAPDRNERERTPPPPPPPQLVPTPLGP